MRTGLLSTSYPRHPHDAAGSFVAGMAGWLAEAGDELEVLAPAPARSVHPGVTVRPLRYALRPRLLYGAGAPDNLRSPFALAQVPAFTLRLALACARRSRRWQGVISHWLLPCGLVAARCARGLPHLAVAHSSEVHLLARLPAGPRLLQLLARQRTALVLTSASLRPPLARLARDAGSERLVDEARVIRMGIAPELLTAATQLEVEEAARRLRHEHGLAGRRVVLFLGRLVPVKGVAPLLAACAGLEDVTLVVVGDGPERPALEARARQLALRVHFVGEQLGLDKAAWLTAAHCLAAPSVILPDGRTDSAPLVLLEAMAAGLPVIASRVGGNAELVSEGENGLLVPPGEVPPLRDALRRLLADGALRRRLAAGGRATAREHTWAVVGPRLREMLLAL